MATFFYSIMKAIFNHRSLLILVIGLLIFSCKKEDDSINDANQDDNQNNQDEIVFGCMTDTACNYNALANQDNESCDYSCYGCTDEAAFNYDSEHTIEDGSCVYANQLIADTWNVSSECDGFILGEIIPDEITIEAGSVEGDIVADFGIFSLNGTIDEGGFINIPSQDISLTQFSLVQVSGTGQLMDEQNVTINIVATALMFSESCILTFTL